MFSVHPSSMLRLMGAFSLCALLTACGGGGNNDNANNDSSQNSNTQVTSTDSSTNNGESTPIPPRITNARGALLQETFLKTDSISAISKAILDPAAKAPSVIPLYEVKNYRLTYLTVDGNGDLTEASGLISLPQKAAGVKSPLLSFQHGTIFYDKNAPSNDQTATNPSPILASLGYIVVAADYVGYGASVGKKHPYLQVTPSAAAVTDFLTAAKQWLAEQRIATNGQLFLTGYSEGGYVTMAAHKALQDAGQTITATVAGAGPYDLQRTLEILFSSSNIKKIIADAVGLRPANAQTAIAAKYPGTLDEVIVDLVMKALIPGDSDVKFDKKFLLDYMADDYETMAKNSVYNWKALIPIRLTHGRDDETVPFENSTRTLDAMRTLGTDIQLDECIVNPSTHSNCIKPYTEYLNTYFSTLAQDL